MAADLFTTYVVILIVTMLLGSLLIRGAEMQAVLYPLALCGVSILSSYCLVGLLRHRDCCHVNSVDGRGTIVALDGYGLIADNAGGIVEIWGLPDSARAITDPLDAAGNTTKAVTNGYAIGSAGLVCRLQACARFGRQEYIIRFIESAGDCRSVYRRPDFLPVRGDGGSLLRGRCSSGRGALSSMIFTGIMDDSGKPEYDKAVDMLTSSAIKKMIIPSLLPVVVPTLGGLILYPAALGSVLMGAIIYFDAGKTDAPVDTLLDKLAAIVAAAKARSDAKIVLSGFHDSTGDLLKKDEISNERAKSVRELLLISSVAEDAIRVGKAAGDYWQRR